MARTRKTSQQGQLEENQKALKRSKKQEVIGGSKASPVAQRSAEGDAQSILNLQRTVGNRVVGKLIAGEGPSIQRDAFYAADKDPGGTTIGGPDTLKMPAAPPGPVPVPMPNTTPASQSPSIAKPLTLTNTASPLDTGKTSSSGNEPGTLKGVLSPTNMGTGVNIPSPVNITPSQTKVLIAPPAGKSQQEEGSAATPPETTATQEPEETSS